MQLPVLLSTSDAETLVSIAEAYQFLRIYVDPAAINTHAEYALIGELLAAAVADAEAVLNYDLRIREWKLSVAGWPSAIELPKAPFLSLTSVQYYPYNETPASSEITTLAATYYQIVRPSDTRAIVDMDPMGDESADLPDLLTREDAVQFTFKTGFTNGNIPKDVKLAILLTLSQYYDDRGNGGRRYPPAADRLLKRHRRGNF